MASLIAMAQEAAFGQHTERISVSSSGEQANAVGEWWYLAPKVAFSATGNLVAFSSDATNLAPRDTNGASDIFVRDRLSGMTHRVSVATPWGQANGLSFGPSLSADGRVVAFLSQATNLVRPRTKARGRYVFVRDLESRLTERVDVSSTGRPGRGGAWGPPILSADGRHVAFTSDAPNLVPGDANGAADVFAHDRETGRTTRVSVDSSGKGGERFSVASAMTPDARFIVFVSESLLAPDAPPDRSSVYVRDQVAGTTTWIGVSGADVFDGSRGAISDDGRFIAFEQRAEKFGVVLWDRVTGITTCVACWDQVPPATWDTLSGMSADGRRIAFARDARTFPQNGAGPRSVFLHDRLTGITQRVSDGMQGARANGPSGIGGLSPDGRFAAFASDASNLVANDTNRRTDLFVRGPF